ncbi:cation:proton antiporter [Kibdelosporangium persicum]|uniref:Kef-type K+ transport system membrane component KefB n=1 Tax=Kibdelosporangium persicum TaxID=2698649 RepID=A0ABX2FGU7_9PSEU|nr:Kef-type K+ transport system membrane component KefB [Kibdelosporangium persicum]
MMAADCQENPDQNAVTPPRRKPADGVRNAAAVVVIVAVVSAGMIHAVPTFGQLGTMGWPLVLRFLPAVALIIAVGRLGGWVATRCRQPRVIGEMAAGIALGPSLLGQFAPEIQHALFPAELIPHLGLIAQLAIIYFVFLLGADLPLELLRGSGRRVAALGVGMVAVPFACGLLLAVGMAATYRPDSVGLVPFLLFFGTSMSITAFPVLVRILAGHNLIRTRIGALGLATAGVGDVISWCMLIVVVAMAQGDSAAAVIPTAAWLILFTTVTLTALRPALRRLLAAAESNAGLRRVSTAVLVLCALSGAAITDWIGIHAIFGALLVGVVVPRENSVVRDLGRTVGRGVNVILPLFFAVIGFSMQIGFLRTTQDLLVCGLMIVVAITSKVGTTTLVGRLTKLTWRESAGLGVMVNCRGLTELVVVAAGLSLGIIGPDLFVMFVAMTLVTTIMTGPLLGWLKLGETKAGTQPVASFV